MSRTSLPGSTPDQAASYWAPIRNRNLRSSPSPSA
jgi:hypothetical protein